MTTQRLKLPELVHREKNGEVTHNEAIRRLDVFSQGAVINILFVQPGASDGDRYIVGVGATGADWGGQDNNIAHYYNTSWNFYTPELFFLFFNETDEHQYIWTGSSWDKKAFFECYGEADLLPPLAPAQALVAATTVGIHGYNNLAVPASKLGVVLTPAGAANSAVFTPNANYEGSFTCDISLELIAPSSGIFQFFVWDGTVDHLIGTRNLTADTLTACKFSGSIQLPVAAGISMEFRVQCDTAQSVTYNSLYAKVERLKA